MSIKLKDIKNEWENYIVLKDHRAVDVVLATVIGNMLVNRDPIWTMIVAPSSGGKSTIVAPVVDIPSMFMVDDLTEKTLLSGYKVGGRDNSLLKTIGTGLMIFSDFTSILSKNPVSRGEILSQLRLVYDRKMTKHTGTGGVEWEGKIGVIACATSEIYYQLEAGRSMGERFIYHWLDVPTDDEIAQKQSSTNISAKDMTDIMKVMYREYYMEVKAYSEKYGIAPLIMTDEQRDRVRKASMFCVSGKATVHTNFKSGKIDQIPQKSSVGRDNKAFEALLQTLQLMDAYETGTDTPKVEDWMVEMIEKCAYSSINRERRAILEIMADSDDELSSSAIGSSKGLGFEKESVEQYIAPLFAVGLVKRNTATKPFKWYIPNETSTKEFIKRVASSVPQIKLKEDEPVSAEDNDFDNF